MTNSNIHFSVDKNAITSSIVSINMKSENARKRFPSVINFMKRYHNVCEKTNKDGTNLFDELISLPNMESHTSAIRSIMLYEYDIKEEDLPQMDKFVKDFYALQQSPEIKNAVDYTMSYKNTIERLWRFYERPILKNIKTILGYQPEKIGKVNAYIMYPIVDTHRTCQISEGKTSLFFGKAREKDKNKILSYLTHQAVHQPMLPYKQSMTRKEKEVFHAFIKYLADKETYTMLSGKSYLDILTPGENQEIMAKAYPYWLGYRYRNADKQGLDSVDEIRKAIKRDEQYFKQLPVNKQVIFKSYEFDKLSPEKIATFFKDKRAYTPYQLAKLNLEDKSKVLQDKYVNKSER